MDAGHAIGDQPPREQRLWRLAAILLPVLVICAPVVVTFGPLITLSRPHELPLAVIVQYDATEEQKASIETYLRTLDTIGDIHYETHYEAYKNFLIRYGHCGTSALDIPVPEVFPESFQFVLANPDDYRALDAHLQTEPGYKTTITLASLTPSPEPCDRRD